MRRILGIVALASLLYLMTMIDSRPQNEFGTCVVGDTSFYPINRLDCRGLFTSGRAESLKNYESITGEDQ